MKPRKVTACCLTLPCYIAPSHPKLKSQTSHCPVGNDLRGVNAAVLVSLSWDRWAAYPGFAPELERWAGIKTGELGIKTGELGIQPCFPSGSSVSCCTFSPPVLLITGLGFLRSTNRIGRQPHSSIKGQDLSEQTPCIPLCEFSLYNSVVVLVFASFQNLLDRDGGGSAGNNLPRSFCTSFSTPQPPFQKFHNLAWKLLPVLPPQKLRGALGGGHSPSECSNKTTTHEA